MSSFALHSVPIAILLAYLPHFAKVIILQMSAAYDNKDPRALSDQTRTLSPEKAALITRLTGAHLNQFEMLGPYCAGVVAALAFGVDPGRVDGFAWLYVLSRVAYLVVYIGPQVVSGYLRSLTFAGVLTAILSLWFEAAAKFPGKA